MAEVLTRGTLIRRTRPLTDTYGLTIGVQLTTTDDDLSIYNWGDDLRAARTLPDEVQIELVP